MTDPRSEHWYVARKRVWIVSFIWWGVFWVATLLWFSRGIVVDSLTAPLFAGSRFPGLDSAAIRAGLLVDPALAARVWGYYALFWGSYVAFFLILALLVRQHLSLGNWRVELPNAMSPSPLVFLLGLVVLANVAFIWLGLNVGGRRGRSVVVDLDGYAAGQMQLHAFMPGLVTTLTLTFLLARSMTRAWVPPKGWVEPGASS